MVFWAHGILTDMDEKDKRRTIQCREQVVETAFSSEIIYNGWYQLPPTYNFAEKVLVAQDGERKQHPGFN